MSWITTQDRDSVRWLTLSNPGSKNAVPMTGWAELNEAIMGFEASPARVLIIRGEGGDFCAGAELDPSVGESTMIERHRRMKTVARAALALHRVTKPTIAAVDGVAVGAGMNLALGCDVVIASRRARFAEIFVKRGLTLDFGGSWLLPKSVGVQRAKELALSGRVVHAEEALEIGLCLEVVEHGDLDDRVAELAKSFLAGAPIAQMFAKQGIDSGWEKSFEDALELEGQSQSICFATDDLTEGVASFLGKRPAEFKGR